MHAIVPKERLADAIVGQTLKSTSETQSLPATLPDSGCFAVVTVGKV